MNFRFVDLDCKKSEYKGFTVRRDKPTLVEQFLIFLVFILTGVIIVLLGNDALGLSAILFTVIGAAAVYVTSQTHRNRTQLQAVELENALFSSSLAKGWAFCLITLQKDGRILYRNPGFNEYFPGAARQVEDWLKEAHAAPEAIARITDSLRNGEGQALPLTLQTAGQQRLSLAMSIETIPRPAGFMLIRCREATNGQ